MPKTTLADRLSTFQQLERIREAYRHGKKVYVFEGVKFRIRRCGPDNNYLVVSPMERGRYTPVVNFPYSMRKHDERMELRRGQQIEYKKSIRFRKPAGAG